MAGTSSTIPTTAQPNFPIGLSADAFAALTPELISQQALRNQTVGISEVSTQDSYPQKKVNTKLAELQKMAKLNVPNSLSLNDINLLEDNRFETLEGNLGILGSAFNNDLNAESITNNNTQPTLGTANLYPQFNSQTESVESYLPVEPAQQNPSSLGYNSELDPFNYSATSLPPGFLPSGTPEFRNAVFNQPVGTLDIAKRQSPESYAFPIAPIESKPNLPKVNSIPPIQPSNTTPVTPENLVQSNVVKLKSSNPSEVKVDQNVKPEPTEKRVYQIFKNKFFPGGIKMQEKELEKLRKESRKQNN